MIKSTLDSIKLADFGTNLVIGANTKSTLDLMKIVETYPNNITIDFTERN
jgi:hypothetical protein